MKSHEMQFNFGPLDGQSREVQIVDGYPDRYYWFESEISDGLVMLQRYVLTKNFEYQFDSTSFGTKSPYAKTYPNGLTREQIQEKNNT